MRAVNACAGGQQAAQMMFSDVSGKLVMALPVFCAEMALGGRFMGGQRHARSAQTEDPPLCNCTRVCSAQIPPAGGGASCANSATGWNPGFREL